MDLFWEYRKNGVVPDEGLMKLFSYFSEMLYYRGISKEEEVKQEFIDNFNFIRPIWRRKENVDFLFKSLDLLAGIKDLDKTFGKVFTVGDDSLKVNLFDSSGVNLFLQLIKGESLDVRKRVLLYSVFGFGYYLDLETNEEKLRDYIRIIRNLLWGVKQVNTSKRVEYISNLRLPNFNDYSKFVDRFANLIIVNS